MMTEDEANGYFAQLSEDDQALLMENIVGAAGPDGLPEDEVVRQTGIVARWLFQTEVSAVLLAKVRAGELRVTGGESDPSFELVR